MKKIWEKIKEALYGILPFLLLFGIPVLLISVQVYLNISSGHKNDTKKSRTYDSGYEEGYENGYYAAISEAPEKIGCYVEEDIGELCYDIENIYGIDPEEAAMILSNFADVPDEVTEDELNKAIWAIYRYYYDSCKIINEIEDYSID